MKFAAIVPVFAATLLAGCAGGGMMGASSTAVAKLQAKSGSATAGSVSFSPRGPNAVRVTVDISGLKPNAEHGFHVHERGDCSAADAMSAGGHFNPAHAKHGGQDGEHHAGDIPNLRADSQGHVSGSFEINGLTADNGPNGVIGKAVVVHRDRDDYKSQPAGDSGPRIACGVVQKA